MMPSSHDSLRRVEPTSRTKVRRHPERAAYDRVTIDTILDEALICHAPGATDPSVSDLPG
jgi:hypothetical protein